MKRLSNVSTWMKRLSRVAFGALAILAFLAGVHGSPDRLKPWIMDTPLGLSKDVYDSERMSCVLPRRTGDSAYELVCRSEERLLSLSVGQGSNSNSYAIGGGLRRGYSEAQ